MRRSYKKAMASRQLPAACSSSFALNSTRVSFSAAAKSAADIVFLEAVEINPVVVHGGGKAINQAMEKWLAVIRKMELE